MSFVRKNDDDKKTYFGVIVGNRDVLLHSGKKFILILRTDYRLILTSKKVKKIYF